MPCPLPFAARLRGSARACLRRARIDLSLRSRRRTKTPLRKIRRRRRGGSGLADQRQPALAQLPERRFVGGGRGQAVFGARPERERRTAAEGQAPSRLKRLTLGAE